MLMIPIKQILHYISQGRTEYILALLKHDNWQEVLHQGVLKPLQWLVYFNDLTGLKFVMENGGSLSSIDINGELGNAAFFGHWKICEFLLQHGADVNAHVDNTQETPLHNALAKAGRPYYYYTVRVLVEKGADVNAKTIPGKETCAFMRDVRTKGETPLHRAAAYSDVKTISFLLKHGADKEAKDAYGDSPLSWASQHLRPGEILSLLTYGDHKISESHITKNISDHGQNWGNAMDWSLFGEYV